MSGARLQESKRIVDRCLSCGRFVGWYPVGFYCDTHCKRCICARCPGVDGPGVYTVVLGVSDER